MTAASIERQGVASSLGGRLATPTTALRIGAAALILIIVAAPLCVLGHQFDLSGWVSEALITFPFTCVGVIVAYQRPTLRMGG